MLRTLTIDLHPQNPVTARSTFAALDGSIIQILLDHIGVEWTFTFLVGLCGQRALYCGSNRSDCDGGKSEIKELKTSSRLHTGIHRLKLDSRAACNMNQVDFRLE